MRKGWRHPTSPHNLLHHHLEGKKLWKTNYEITHNKVTPSLPFFNFFKITKKKIVFTIKQSLQLNKQTNLSNGDDHPSSLEKTLPR